MVFLIDDLVEGTAITSLIASIASFVFASSEVAADITLTEEMGIGVAEGITTEEAEIDAFANEARLNNPIFDSKEAELILTNTLDSEGVEGAIEISEGLPNLTRLPAYDYYEKMFNDFVLSNTNGTVDKNSLMNSISKIANSVAKKVPRDSAGFKKLIIDIVRGAMANPKKLIGVGIAGIGVAAAGKTVYDQLKASYNGGRHLPRDIEKTAKDVVDGTSKVVKDTKQDVDDLIDMLPGTLEQ